MASLYFRYWLLSAILLMIGCPYLAVTFASDAGMAICFILFFAVNPLFSVISGLWAGNHANRLYGVPFITAILFLVGAWSFFDTSEPLFLIYSGIYLFLGLIAMILRSTIKK